MGSEKKRVRWGTMLTGDVKLHAEPSVLWKMPMVRLTWAGPLAMGLDDGHVRLTKFRVCNCTAHQTAPPRHLPVHNSPHTPTLDSHGSHARSRKGHLYAQPPLIH